MNRTEREGKFLNTQRAKEWGRNIHPGIQTNKSCEEVCIPGTLTPSKYAFKRFMQRKQDGFDASELSPHFQLRSKLLKEIKSVQRKKSQRSEEEIQLPRVDASKVTLKKVIRDMIIKNKM
jgi:hypothetical protein